MEQSAQVKTGIPTLDELLGGGLLKGSTTLLIGPAGTLKSYIGQQFIREGLKEKERCVYISTIQSLRDFEYQMKLNLGWDVKPYIDNGQLLFVDIYDLLIAKGLEPMRSSDVRKIVKKIVDAEEKAEGGRTFFHNLTPLFNVLKDERTVQRLVLFLKADAKKRNITLMLMLDEGAQSKQTEAGLKSFCDYVLATRALEGGMRVLRVEKSLVRHDLRWHELFLEKEGVKIEKS